MMPANDLLTAPDVVRIRRTLQASLAKLMEAQEHLKGQITSLTSIEQQVRLLALRESSRCLNDQADLEELQYLRDLQEQTNANFCHMHQSYAALSAQIAKLMMQHEWLYEATFAQGGSGPKY
ncbi:hypothetical protein [Methylobacterium sp. 37f]|uniref:hypothetical protein n=1 Tax=Methylobacterium sp. 37f TaxID=2817058 RepID=UPI001FFDE5BC|nr:hypothetical protein [Methylobacterium sp. 37f]MCK2055320.1 hypothetical protein [Methylobacterium sp. 37f]